MVLRVSITEIPLFHVLNARITFGSVNKCGTEEQVSTPDAVSPTPSSEGEEAAGRTAAGSSSPLLLGGLGFCRRFMIECMLLSVREVD